MKGFGNGIVAVFLFLNVDCVEAATRTWTGAAANMPGFQNNFWTNQFNWSGNVAPVAGDDLVFIGGIQSTSTNTFAALTTFNTLTVTGHVIGGAPVALNGGILSDGGLVNLVSIKLNQSQTFSSSTANNSLVINSAIDTNGFRVRLDGVGNFLLNGVLSGTGGVTKSGSGDGTLTAANTYTGFTRPQTSGVLQVTGSQPGSSVDIETGTLGGNGTVGPVLVRVGSAVLAPGAVNNGTAVLTVSGNLTFSPNEGTLAVDLKGTSAGSGYDQVNVVNNGAVDLSTGSDLIVAIGSGFTPAPGAAFVIINNDGTDAIQGNFFGLPEGTFFTVSGTIFFLTYKGGDGNDLVLSVPARWDGGGGDNNWMTAANWVGDVAPVSGQALLFPNGAPRNSNTNNFPNGTFFPGILSTGGYGISGNAITLGAGGLIARPGVLVVTNDITLAAPSTFEGNGGGAMDTLGDIDLGPHTLTLNALSNSRISFSGAVTGTGEIHKFGGQVGRLDIDGPATVGAIKIFGGDLKVESPVAAPVVLDAAGTGLGAGTANEIELTGNGSVGPLTVGGADVSGGTFGGVGRLTINGNLVFVGNVNLPGRILVDLAGGTGNNQDKLIVNGTVNLTKADVLVRFRNGFAPAVGSTFVIIANDSTDPVQGTFVSKPEGSTFVVGGTTFRVNYNAGDGNDVVLAVVAAAPTPAASPSLGNISTRLRVLGGDDVLIGGMIATGTQGKLVIIRAIGPTLTDLGLPGALTDPTLELFRGNSLVASNDDWRLSDQQTDIENSGFAPGKEKEAAIIVSLDVNQNYTAIVRGKNGETGVGLVEAFDLDELVPAKLANISTRGFVDVDDNVMIAGLIVSPPGAANIKVLVRALGPLLGDFGVAGFLADPTLDLVGSNGSVIRSSNDWKNDGQRTEIEAAGLAPTHDEEAALIQTLPPGSYTAIVRGLGRTTGVGLVEVYNIP